MGDVFVITEHLKGEFQDITFEMLGKAKEMAAAFDGQCVAVAFGSMNEKVGELGERVQLGQIAEIPRELELPLFIREKPTVFQKLGTYGG